MASIADFEQPFYGLKRQGSTSQPKTVTLIVVAWQPRDKAEPMLSAGQLRDLFFGPVDSVAHWFSENSQGRYRLVPHPTRPIIGPLQSVYPWFFYWRNDPAYVRRLLCGNADTLCQAWQDNPYKVPPPQGDPHRHVDQTGRVLYLDDQGYTGGHTHSWAEAIRAAATEIRFGDLVGGNGVLSVDDGLVVVVKAQASTFGTRRDVTGSDVPPTDLEVTDPPGTAPARKVKIHKICELYAAPPHGRDDLAVGIEEVLHLAANLADQYPDVSEKFPQGNLRRKDDPGRPGELALTDAGHRPVHIDPFHKLKWGWLNPQLADRSGRYTLRDAATTGDALILFSPYLGISEFFILENRWRGSSYDRFRSSDRQDGLALWHCIQDPQLSWEWARRAVDLRRADPSLDSKGRIRLGLTLFDGSDPARGYDLHDDSRPQNLRFRNGVPSRIRVRNISPAGAVMSVDVEVPPAVGDIVATEGTIRMLRAHERGTGYGPAAHVIGQDAIVTLDSEPGAAFGVELNEPNAPAGRRMFDRLRRAFSARRAVRLEYQATSALGGRVVRVVSGEVAIGS